MKKGAAAPFHLTVDMALEIHADVLEAFGGLNGVRDIALLESAIAAPQATFAGSSPFADEVEMAAAYLFYLCRNHPFFDGNKRVALVAAVVFLRLNGIATAPDGPALESLVMDVAASMIGREEATRRLRKLMAKKPKSSP